MAIPDKSERPPGQVTVPQGVTQYGHSSGGPFFDIDSAWASAINDQATDTANAGEFRGSITSHPDYFAPHYQTIYTAELSTGDYRWRFFSATCYLKLWWKETKTVTDAFGAVISISETDKEFEWLGHDYGDGYCVPSDCNGITYSTFPVSDVYTVSAEDVMPPAPPTVDPDTGAGGGTRTLTLTFTHIRCTFLPGYVPPADGSANGFPV